MNMRFLAVAAAAAASFAAAPALAAPVITSVPMPPATGCLQKGMIFSIIGKDFAPQNGQGAALGGSGINVNLPVMAWFPTTVRVTLPNDPKITGTTYYVGLKAANGNWTSNLYGVKVCK